MAKKIIFLCVLIAGAMGSPTKNDIYENTTEKSGCPFHNLHNNDKIIVPLHSNDKFIEENDPNPLIIPAVDSSHAVGYLSPQEVDLADRCFKEPKCDTNYPFRTFDGSCNNLIFPTWGQAVQANTRIIEADYADGVHEIRKAKSGNPLPNARKIRTKILPIGAPLMKNMNLNLMQFGQLISHDTTLVMFDFEDKKTHHLEQPLKCCGPNGTMPNDLPKGCISVAVPHDDPDFKKECLNIKRALTTKDVNCDIAPVRQLIDSTSFIDGSVIYGSNNKTAKSLRSFKEGKLVVQKGPDGKDFFTNVDDPSKVCAGANNNTVCYKSGDSRVTQHPGIAVAMISLLRLHNQFCDQLLAINPHWDDERTYQEAKKLVSAIFQHISYGEYVPALLGKDFSKANKLLPVDKGHINTYDKFLNPTTITTFESAAFRVGHTQVRGDTMRIDDKWNTRQVINLSDSLNKVSEVQELGQYDSIHRALLKQASHGPDRFFQKDITDLLFISPSAKHGTDLITIDIQRGRDYGEPSYNKFRQLCGMPKANTFDDLKDQMPLEHIKLLQDVYEDVDDIDMYVAGLLEHNRPGAVVGPTFQCILGEMFFRWKFGDRFYYEFNHPKVGFTADQLDEIRKFSLAHMLCETTGLSEVPMNAFFQIDDKMNPLVPCSSMKKFAFTAWKENK